MRIAVCIPHSFQTLHKPFTLSLLSVIRSFDLYNYKTGNKHELTVLMQNEGWIDQMREMLVLSAKKYQADYILWLDTDMTFPPDLIARMLKHFESDETLDAITGLYTWKKPPFMPHVYSRLNEETGKFAIAGSFPLREPFIVEGAGYGCLMIKASKYPDNMRPWFVMERKDDEIVYGEDLYFFKKMHPVNMICDPTISCLHFVENAYDINSYIDYNGIKRLDNGEISATDEELKKIGVEHLTKIKRLQK